MKAHFIILAFLFSSAAHATQTCGEVADPVPYKYCITKMPNSSETDVLFLLHGAGGDENSAEQVIAALDSNWQKQKIKAPITVTISFGSFWLLIAKNGPAESGLLEVFNNSIMPEMEKRAVGGVARKRMLLGFSMGSFNSAQVLLKAQPNQFAKAALVCPAMADISPWASSDEITAFSNRLNIPIEAVEMLATDVKIYVQDEAFYKTQVDPIGLASTKLKDSQTEILIAVNEDDQIFRDGGERFAAEAKKSGVKLSKETWPGKHCHLNVPKLAEFLK